MNIIIKKENKKARKKLLENCETVLENLENQLGSLQEELEEQYSKYKAKSRFLKFHRRINNIAQFIEIFQNKDEKLNSTLLETQIVTDLINFTKSVEDIIKDTDLDVSLSLEVHSDTNNFEYQLLTGEPQEIVYTMNSEEIDE